MSKFKIITKSYDTHTSTLGFALGSLGLVFYAREYWKYKSWFVVPGLSVDYVSGYDYYVDIEIKILFLGFGLRFIKRRTKK